MTFPDGNSLHGLATVIANLRGENGTRVLDADELASIGMGERPRDVQGSPYVARNNLFNLRAAINNVPREILAEALADMLAHRFGKARASLILRNAAAIVEGGK